MRLMLGDTNYDSAACRLVPTSFDPNDPGLTGFPIPTSWRWTSAAAALREFRPHGVMMRLPLFWQMEVPLWHACRTVRVPIFLNDPGNMPVGAMAIARGGIDTVVTEGHDALDFSSYLRDGREMMPRNWLIIHRATDPWKIDHTITGAAIAQEIHVIPGVPAFYQCAQLIHERASRYHVFEEYEYDLPARELRISGDGTLPAHTLGLPDGIRSDAVCICGKTTFIKP